MKTYQSTPLFNKDGTLVSTDVSYIAQLIIETEIKTIASDHDSKLMRIEIGGAIRAVAAMGGTTLTEAIVNMDLCRTTNRAEKTFLKYARIAGSATLMDMATNPQISLSVLDEIAASKKPPVKADLGQFMKRIRTEVDAICDQNREDEGIPGEEGKLIVLGITRNQAVGIIRRVQIEMGVKTRAGNGGNPERPDLGDINSKTLQLVNLFRIMFLPFNQREEWLAKHGLVQSDVGATMISLQNDLVEAGIIAPHATDLKPEAVVGLKKLQEITEVV